MRLKIKNKLQKLHPKYMGEIAETFLKDEALGGKLILGAALLSIIVVNSVLRTNFTDFWSTNLTLGFGRFSTSLDVRHWLNEGLMSLFFLVVGLEIKREIVSGEMRNIKSALLPIGAAFGGMIVPALIYLLFNNQADSIRGWGIPIATDIAFAVTVLTLLGKRVPTSLKIFLLTLAIADDIGAIIVIALFYAEIIRYSYLFASMALVSAIWIFRKHLQSRLVLFVTLGVILWITTHMSGIHASIVGAAMGLLAPIPVKNKRASVAVRLEKFFLPITTFIILPLFAFANAGFVISRAAFSGSSSAVLGIIFGLVAGKTIGITGASWLLVKLRIAKMPEDIRWRQIFGVGLIAGIGFTVSIFITELAFPTNFALIATAKLSIFIASALSAILGVLVLTSRPKKQVNASQV
jgi:Na+:H+ antiporter, NhaA family